MTLMTVISRAQETASAEIYPSQRCPITMPPYEINNSAKNACQRIATCRQAAQGDKCNRKRQPAENDGQQPDNRRQRRILVEYAVRAKRSRNVPPSRCVAKAASLKCQAGRCCRRLRRIELTTPDTSTALSVAATCCKSKSSRLAKIQTGG